MAKTYNTHSYSGTQMLEPIVEPHIQDKAIEDFGITVETTEDNAYEFTSTEEGDDNIYPYSDGFQGGDGANNTDKGVKLVEFKKETSWSKQKYKNRIQRRQIQRSARGNNLEGTAAHELEIAMHMRGVRIGIWKSFWLGDTTKTHTVPGRYVSNNADTAFLAGDTDKRYSSTNGIWTEIMNRQATDNIPRVTLDYVNSNPLIDVSGSAPTLKDDAAKEMMRQAYMNASDELKAKYDMGEAVFYYTRAIGDNYQNTMEEGGSEAAYRATLYGIERMGYRDIPMVDMRIQGTILKDFANVNPYRIMLTTPENLAMVIGLGSFAESEYWFNKDENQNRQRTQFEMEHCFINPKLLSVVY